MGLSCDAAPFAATCDQVILGSKKRGSSATAFWFAMLSKVRRRNDFEMMAHEAEGPCATTVDNVGNHNSDAKSLDPYVIRIRKTLLFFCKNFNIVIEQAYTAEPHEMIGCARAYANAPSS